MQGKVSGADRRGGGGGDQVSGWVGNSPQLTLLSRKKLGQVTNRSLSFAQGIIDAAVCSVALSV